MERFNKTGLDVAIYWRSVIWLMDCPFDKAVKPDLDMSSTEMREFHDKLEGIWVGLRDKVGIDNVGEATVPVTFSSQEVRCLRQCLHAVLAECDGDPLELEIRVGEVEDVWRLAKELDSIVE
ncbi:hypothetical protein [Gimesia sp.]|uniref:hypothetical protein n=1 Tax=Gimesia sp. TaxID=2024833 RepID=UPI003A8DAE32